MADPSPRRAELRKLCEQTSKLPWSACKPCSEPERNAVCGLIWSADGNTVVATVDDANSDIQRQPARRQADMALIVGAVGALPELLDENERLEREVELSELLRSERDTARARVAELEVERGELETTARDFERTACALLRQRDDAHVLLDDELPKLRALVEQKLPAWLTPELVATVERWRAGNAETRSHYVRCLRSCGRVTEAVAADVLAALSPAEPAEER